MKLFRFLLPLALFALAAACTRSASTPPPGEEEAVGPQDPQQATMEAVRSALLTQTAQAEGEDTVQLPTEIPATSTPVVEQPAPTDEPPPPTEPPTEAAGDFVEYTVQPGDWLFKIANDFGVDPQAIVDLNGLTSPGQVQVGMVLKIPPSTGATATPTATGSAGGTVHTVKEGEWIWSIARIYGVDPQAIIDANNLTNIDLIFPGMELVIP